MSERRTIGQILTSCRRMSEDDVAIALEYQRETGASSVRRSVSWGSSRRENSIGDSPPSSTFPTWYPDAESVDLEAAARSCLPSGRCIPLLPMLKTADELKVVIDSPMKRTVEELIEHDGSRGRAGSRLPCGDPRSDSAGVRHGERVDEEPMPPVDLARRSDVLSSKSQPGSGSRCEGPRQCLVGRHGGIRRRPWSGTGGSRRSNRCHAGDANSETRTEARWDAELTAWADVRVLVDYIADESGREFLLNPSGAGVLLGERFRLRRTGSFRDPMFARARGGALHRQVEPDELGQEVLPHLPTMLLDPSWRSIYINAQ